MLSIRKGFDAHLHVRDGQALADIVGHSAYDMQAAIIMPNLSKPVVSVELAEAYRRDILAALPPSSSFTPWMTLYLSNDLNASTIQAVADHPHILGVKLYPAGVTTHAHHGIRSLANMHHCLEWLERWDIPLLIHGEVNDPAVDIFDREKVFINQYLQVWAEQFPRLRMVLEHITTAEAVQFVQTARPGVAASITAHHLMFDRNALFSGGLNPHMYCLPILKRAHHRQALRDAVCSGLDKFFAGTDSAPHPQHHKEQACGCAGIFSAHAAMALYTQIFEELGILPYLQAFSSERAAAFYGITLSDEMLTLEPTSWTVPKAYTMGQDRVIPFMAGQSLSWQVQPPSHFSHT